MGNTASSSKGDGKDNSHSDPKASPSTSQAQREKAVSQAPRRRESVPTVRSTAAPPSATFESAHAHSSAQTTSHTSSSSGQQHAHSRQRSQTSTGTTSRLHSSVVPEESRENVRAPDTAQQSHQRMHSPSAIGGNHPSPLSPEENQRSNPGSKGSSQGKPDEALDPLHAGSSPSNYYVPSAQYNRPPRLPLPIEEEVLSPGSPIMSPADFSGPIGGDVAEENDLARNNSIRSSTTADDEEAAEDEFQAHGRATGQMVDTLVEWKEGGDRVYVTGSFSGWNKKHRLQKNGPSRDPNAFSALVPLLVGAHHMTFLVDGQMRTSKYLPTAVDYTNVLINYVEIAPSDTPRPSAPVDIQRTNQSQQPKSTTTERPGPPPSRDSGQVLPPPTPDLKPTHKSGIPSAGPSIASSAVPLSGAEQPAGRQTSSSMMRTHTTGLPRRAPDSKEYHNEIPPFLVDLDAHEESRRFARANATLETQPQPPALPTFLTKSILNGTLPMKDDASVLVMPNHTVLNHMATTSIKSKILATSATTRYKRKYVTTILYKPTIEQKE